MIDDNYDARAEIEKLHADFYQPDKFAKIFCEVARSQKSVDLVLKEISLSLLKSDKDIIDSVKAINKEAGKEGWWGHLKTIKSGGWAVILVIIGAALNHFYTLHPIVHSS